MWRSKINENIIVKKKMLFTEILAKLENRAIFCFLKKKWTISNKKKTQKINNSQNTLE